MALDVLSALNMDKEGLNCRFFLVKELSGCDGGFVHSCIVSKLLKEGGSLCFTCVHRPLDHYHAVGLKMGYNLKSHVRTGTVSHIDFPAEHSKNNFKLIGEGSLFEKISEFVVRRANTHSRVCVMIDDLMPLLYFDSTLSDVMKFVQKLKTLMSSDGRNCVFVGVHTLSSRDESYAIAQLLSHASDTVCEIEPLKTGMSPDVTGSFKIVRPWCKRNVRLTELDRYLYKAFDRGVKVFAPGSR